MMTGVPTYENWPETIGNTMGFCILVDFIFLDFYFPTGTCYLQVGSTEMTVLVLLDAKTPVLHNKSSCREGRHA